MHESTDVTKFLPSKIVRKKYLMEAIDNIFGRKLNRDLNK